MEGKQILQTATVLSVKIKFNEDIRRLSCPATVAWENLKAEVLAKYGLDPKAKVCLKYEDEEGDLVTLGCEADFKEALNIISATKLLRLTIVKVKRESAPAKSADVVSPVDVVSTAPATTVTPRAPVTGVPGRILTKEEFKRLKKESKEHKHEHKHEDKSQLKEAKRAMKEQLKSQKEACKAAKGSKFVARFVKDVATLDETELAPETTFVKTWRFRNEGDRAWPEGCQLIFVSKLNGDQMGAPASVPVASADVGQEIDVSVPMVAPTTPGRYVGFWRLCTADGQKFGQRVRVLIQVTSTSSSSDSTTSSSGDEAAELAPLLLQMEQMGFTNKEKNARVLKKHQGNLASAVACLTKKQQLKAEKAAQKAAEKAEKKAKKAAQKASKEKAKQQKKEAKSAASTPRK